MTPTLFRRKEKETAEAKGKHTPSVPEKKTLLEELCKGNKELHDTLNRTLLLDPETTTKEGIDFYEKQAEEYEANQKSRNARIAYQIAGEIALHEGKLQQIQKFFKKAAEAEPDYENKRAFEYFNKKENAEKAIAVAQEYYTKTTKRTPA
jgi:tetratricopeptide (TPR) repeat protein